MKYDVLSTMLRVSYLLMDNIAACGDTGKDIFSVEMLKRASIKAKILILETFFEEMKYTDYLEVVRRIKKAYKEESAIKNRDRKVFLAYAKLLHSIDQLYDGYIKWLLDSLKKSGLVELKNIIDEDIFTLMDVVNEKEIKFKRNVSKLSPSSLLQSLMASAAAEPRILWIANDLLNCLFINEKKVYRYSDPEAADENEVYLYKCLTIPTPSSLMATELIAVRKSLRASTIDLNNALRDWSYCFLHNDSAEIKIDRLAGEVITQFPSIQTAIDNNSILQYQKTINNEKEIKVWIGEAPLPVVWDYYKYYGIIDEEVYGLLQSALAENDELKNRIPIIVIETGSLLKTDAGLSEKSALKDDILELTARKYISIS